MEDRNAKYINLANDYGRASKKKVAEFCQQHHVEPEEACIAIVGGSKYGGPENALMIWNSLKHGTKAAQELHALDSCACHRHVDFALTLGGKGVDARNEIMLAVERGEAKLRRLQKAHKLLWLFSSQLQGLCDRLHQG